MYGLDYNISQATKPIDVNHLTDISSTTPIPEPGGLSTLGVLLLVSFGIFVCCMCTVLILWVHQCKTYKPPREPFRCDLRLPPEPIPYNPNTTKIQFT